METETLSNYEQKHLENTMDMDIPQEDESASPVNKTYEENTESTDVQNQAETKDKETENEVTKPGIEIESEEECEEEEEEKLLLSPAHSDKAYDSDDDPLSPPLNRDLEESDNEGDKEEKTDASEKDKEEISETSKEEKLPILQTEEEKDEIVGIDEEEKINSENLQNNLDDNKNSEDDEDKTKNNNGAKCEENTIEDDPMVESQEDKKSDKPDDDIQTVDNEDSEDKDPLDNENIDSKQDKDIDTSNDKILKKDEQFNSKESKEETDDEKKNKIEEILDDEKDGNKNDTKDKIEEILDDEKDGNKNDSKDKIEEILDDEKDGNKKDTKDKIEEILDDEKDANKKDTKDKIEEIIDDEKHENKNDTKDNEKTTEPPSTDDTHRNEDNSGIEKNDHSLLKESLIKPFDDGREPEVDEEMDMDEDFDPSLLCPELSMEVDEAPVITTNDAPAPETDGSKSPLRLYDPIFSTFVDEMTGAEVDFNLTAEELELKVKTYGPKNPIQFTKIHCTACNVHLGSALDGQGNRFVHPLLKVLICKKCYHFYTSGEFEKDEDGSELYCRWCGQGGQVMCCSNCEMVFCKKCIRINFDRKKLSDIQKSDEWMCFRCNPSQLIHLRIHCAEFMEYVQLELRRASSSGNVEAFMNTDYCQCCIPQKKKAPDAAAATPTQSKKRKRNTGEEDPDYDPTKEREEVPPPVVTPSTSQQVIAPKTPTFSPRVTPNAAQIRPNLMRPGLASQNRARMPIMTPPGIRPQQSFLKVMPGGVRLPGSSVSNATAAAAAAAAAARPGVLRHIRPSNTMKHEWFEKTVRAAARVNSNLSYTLTQLNRAQANATSVEGLAVVHNKLQEILSSSINSLIQIRKNLRTEFIAGIKNLRFPPKPTSTPPQASTSKDDDDVIFVPSDPSPPCPPLVPVSNNTTTNKINLPPSISLVKKSQPTPTTTPTKATPSTSGVTVKSPGSVAKKSTSAPPPPPPLDDSNRPKGFLRVKSFSALQSVPSECITIPDDPPDDEPKIVEEKDPLDVSDDSVKEKDEKTVNSQTNGITNGEKGEDERSNKDGETPLKVASEAGMEDEDSNKDGDTPLKIDGVRLLKPATIVLHRSQEIDDMVKTKFDVVNGDVTD